jgi:HK97 family phage major capsid protein
MNLQEMFTKEIVRKDTVTEIRKAMDSSTDNGFYDAYEYNIYGTGIRQNNPLPLSKAKQLKEVLDTLTLQQLCEKAGYGNRRIKEFIAQSGTTGMQGAAYLIPDKIYQTLITSAVETDVVAAISREVLGPDQIPGSSVKVDIISDETYVPYKFSSGGDQPQMHPTTVQATITPISWGINFNIGNDLIEDSQFDIVNIFVQEAGREMGEYASNEALTILSTAPDGDGTLNSGLSGDADETRWINGTTMDVNDAQLENADDGYRSDSMVATTGALLHSIIQTTGAQYAESSAYDRYIAGGWPTQLGPLTLTMSDVSVLTNSKAGTDLVTIVFSKQFGIITGRKRWMRIENYSEPVMDLVGATVTARQDSASLYKDSICVITET